jgi:hypothetical protein
MSEICVNIVSFSFLDEKIFAASKKVPKNCHLTAWFF